ncbi:MAG: tetratricopeptide repeat protein [Planctomycetota bacterium]
MKDPKNPSKTKREEELQLLELLETHPKTPQKKIASSTEETQFQILSPIESESEILPLQTQNKTMLSPSVPNSVLVEEPDLPEEKRYEKIKTLGEGGMGIVELVKDHLLGREVARKTIKINPQAKNFSKQQAVLYWRFKKEVSITAILEHPNIIPVYEMQQKKGTGLQFTMRKVEGETLRQLFTQQRNKKVPEEELRFLNIFFKVCDAVAYAHSKRVIHRDLKPENIMVGQFGEVYVMDWGIAKQLDSKEEEPEESILSGSETDRNHTQKIDPETVTEMKTVGGLGTQGYMSLEQAENASKVTPASDIFALGKILRECFTWFSPQEEFQLELKSFQIQQKQGPPKKEKFQRKLDQRVPLEIQAIVQKATQEETKNRYQSVSEMGIDLQNYQKNLKVSAKEYGALETLVKWVKRNRSKMAKFTMFFAICVAFVFYIAWKDQRVLNENIVQNRLAIAQKYLARLDQIIYNFRNGFREEGDRDDAVFEISKMQEKVVLEKLITLTNEGTRYMIKSLERAPKEVELYQMLIEAIGRMENPEASDCLITSLQDILDQKISQYPLEQEIPLDLTEYMENLAFALKNVNGFSFMAKFQEIRMAMQKHKSLFFTHTINIDQKLKLFFYSESTSRTNDPKSFAGRYFIQGQLKLNRKDYSGAISDFSEAIRLNPQYVYAYDNRGAAKYEKGNFTEAIADYTEAIRLNPNAIEIYNNRGRAKQGIGDLDGAITDYSQAIRLNPQIFEAYNNRGTAKQDKGDLDGAIADYTEAILLNPQLYAAYLNRGETKHNKKIYHEAMEDYTEAIRLNPKGDMAYNSRSLIKLDIIKDIEGALSDVNEAIRLNPNNSHAYSNRAIIKKEKKDFEGALSDFSEAIRLNPKYEENYFNRGYLKKILGEFDKAIADYSEAIRLNPQFYRAYFQRGMIKLEKKDLQKAKQDFKIFLDATQNSTVPQITAWREQIIRQLPELKK